jgi:hypothetical protein
MSLAKTQAELADALRRATSLKDDPGMVATAERIASGNDRLSPVEQVDIYREQFWFRHADVLREDFASIEHALGDDEFERLARAYLSECPSPSFTLRDYGIGMLQFLQTREPWSSDPFLAELARVEWAFVDAFDGPNAPPFDPATIAGVSEDAWPHARILLHPSLQRLSLAWPSHDYRIAARKSEQPVRPEPQDMAVVVYRGPELLHCLEIDADAAALLDELARGVPLGEACERAAAHPASGGLDALQTKLGGWFAQWTSLGWIRAVEFPAQ